MNRRHPPRLAIWLVQRFGVTDGLVGDLIEQYERRGSSTWLWRQALIAIALQLRVSVVLATLIGFGIYGLSLLFNDWLNIAITVWFFVYVWSGLGILLLGLSHRH